MQQVIQPSWQLLCVHHQLTQREVAKRLWAPRVSCRLSFRSISTTNCSSVGKRTSAGGRSSEDSATRLAKSLLRDLVAGVSNVSSTPRAPRASSTAASAALPEDLRSPAYAIPAANLATFLVCALVPMLPAASLLLNHHQPAFWQLLTSCFAHPSLEGLMQCVFFTYVFGRVVERSHGWIATWAVYVACGMAASALAWWLLPDKIGLLSSAAPAAAWGLFMVGLGLPRLVRKPLELACLGPFALAATIGRYAPLSTSVLAESTPVGHLVHIAGATLAAAVAAAVLAVVEGVQAAVEAKRQEEKRQAEATNQEEAVNRVINIATQAAVQLGKKLT